MSVIAATALSGARLAAERFGTAARSLAGGPQENPAGDVAATLVARRDFEANLLVLRAHAGMTERLLDILA
jgi:hypothetical protein